MTLHTVPQVGVGRGGLSPWVREESERFQFLVARAAFTQKEILEIERAAIFDRCWIYVGHDSEIPNNNDFLTRSVAGRELVFSRDRGGAVHCFMNVCPHRGAMVVREKTGNALGFQCFYHGWAFNNNGAFATRIANGNYPENFNADGCKNMPAVPRLESYRGLYFVNFDANAIGLEEYLANAKEFIDLIMDHGEAGMEIVGGTQEYAVRANWKLLVENSYDGYHAVSTHATYFDYLGNSVGALDMSVFSGGATQNSRAHDLGHGHAVVEGPAPWGRPVAQWIPAWGEEGRTAIDGIKANLTARFGAERAERIARKNRNLGVFPNLVINDVMAVTVRTFYPEEPDYMNVNAWALAPVGEPVEFRKRRLFNFLEFLGPGGFATPDDVEALEACQKGYRNRREAPWNDISKGMMKPVPATDDEAQMRAFWREWDRRVAAFVAEN
ncbi:aromatic ring-hydroxylating oxygenase subunit alpha [Zavarzinia sp. CC-PAN008]|uniref:aromatic ring-hydroxylating oxygenase subunit alpha n=1 Tax=Zavarzinia sp. CC-PAN008 TaxID=3243332 RepID=UPI003F742918